MSVSQNEFGPNVFVDDVERVIREMGIEPHHRVLEVGGGGNPFRRADVVCDLTFGESSQRNGAPGEFRDDVTYVEANAEDLPFADDEFDLVWCTQVMEHVADPIKAAAELSRVAKRGFIEVPSRLGEMACGNPSHRWVIDVEDGVMVFHHRHFVEHPFANFFYGTYFQRKDIAEASAGAFRNVFNHQVIFGSEGLKVRVEDPKGPTFDYDDPVHAARAHYSFARNCLIAGTEASYCLPDARIAARLMPEAADARMLLAVHEARLLRFEDALETLRGLDAEPAPTLRRLVERLQAGEGIDPNTIPVPGGEVLSGEVRASSSARVTILCVGEDEAELVLAAESALVQDHPDVQVVVAGPIDPGGAGWKRLQMGDRLTLLPLEGGGEGLYLNRAAAHVQSEWVGFCLGGDRLMADHVGRLLAQAHVTGRDLIRADQLLEEEGLVLAEDLRPGNPASAAVRLTTVLVRAPAALENGPFIEDKTGLAPSDWLGRLAARLEVEHLAEVTSRSRAPRPESAAVLELAAAGMRLNPFELARDLISACARERGLEARIKELESRLASSRSE